MPPRTRSAGEVYVFPFALTTNLVDPAFIPVRFTVQLRFNPAAEPVHEAI